MERADRADGSDDRPKVATWPKPQQCLHCVYRFEEYVRSIVLERVKSLIVDPIIVTSPELTDTMTECNMCTCSGNGTQERAVQDRLCLVDLYLVYLI